MKGKAAVVIWCDVDPAIRPEFEEWHSTEHIPERVAIPGFLRGSRWVSGDSFFMMYELDDPATLTGAAYLERLNNPTPWSRKMMPHHRNMVRALCAVRASHGQGLPQAMATIRFTPRADLTQLPAGKGITGAHLLQAQPMPGTQTTEQKIRGGDATADWVLLVGGYDAQAVERAAQQPADATRGLYRLSYSLSRT